MCRTCGSCPAACSLPVLEERGLEAALTELAARHAESGFAMRVSQSGQLASEPRLLNELDARVSAAAYAVISESVLNAARYSGVREATIELSLRDDHGLRLVIACHDDGAGRPPQAADGVGTRSMRERTEELGGSLAIESGRGGTGTTVRAELPLTPAGVPL